MTTHPVEMWLKSKMGSKNAKRTNNLIMESEMIHNSRVGVSVLHDRESEVLVSGTDCHGTIIDDTL